MNVTDSAACASPQPRAAAAKSRQNTLVAAIDIGGTSIKAALFLPDGVPLHSFRVPTPRHLGPEAVMQTVTDTAAQLLDLSHRHGGTRPTALGVACLGLVDEHRGTAVYSAAVGWRDLPLVQLLQACLQLPVALRQDIRAAAVAETTAKDRQETGPVLFVAIGTGIGAAITIGRQVLGGAHSRAGELGHLQVRLQGHRCSCGARGCLETYSSAAAIAATAARARGHQVSAAEVSSAAAQGLAWAVPIWQEAVDALADGLVASTMILDPARIVVGGGPSLAGPDLLGPLRLAVARRYPFGEFPPVDLARFGDTGALRGAAMSARDLLLTPDAA